MFVSAITLPRVEGYIFMKYKSQSSVVQPSFWNRYPNNIELILLNNRFSELSKLDIDTKICKL